MKSKYVLTNFNTSNAASLTHEEIELILDALAQLEDIEAEENEESIRAAECDTLWRKIYRITKEEKQWEKRQC